MILYLQDQFSSAHFYHQPAWDNKKNQQTFGRCFTKYGHGHNYTVEVGFRCEEQGLNDRHIHYKALLREICYELDHEHLNFSIPEFKTVIPTTENIAVYILEKLKTKLDEDILFSLKLYEMKDLWTEIRL